MRVLVVNVAAQLGGALSILRDFHAAVFEGTDHEWTFVVSTPRLHESRQVRVRNFPWVKKSWAHRLWFDQVTMRSIIRDAAPDVVLSMQNVPVPGVAMRQVVYLHQALPFTDFAFDFRQDPAAWVYHHVTRHRILAGLRKDVDFIVQSDWMNDAVAHRRQPGSGRVVTITPAVSAAAAQVPRLPEQARRHFFYPAGALPYKNHATIVRAVDRLNETGCSGFEVTFTVTAAELERLGVEGIPHNIRLVGSLPREDVYTMYGVTTLLFPSLVESVSLPLLEARLAAAPVIASSLPFAQEALEGYGRAQMVEPESVDAWAQAMLQTMRQEDEVEDYVGDGQTSAGDNRSWAKVISVLCAGEA